MGQNPKGETLLVQILLLLVIKIIIVNKVLIIAKIENKSTEYYVYTLIVKH